MTVLVTGGTGFIGRSLVDALLQKGVQVGVLTRKASKVAALWPARQVEVVVGDVTGSDPLTDACRGVETIFHLASHSPAVGEKPEAEEAMHKAVTVEGTQKLIRAAIVGGVKKLVFLSSVKAMGEGSELCLDECSAAHPETAYGKAKLEAEAVVLEAGRRGGIHVCVVRLPPVYGRENPNLLRMIQALDRRYFFSMKPVKNKRSMVHVEDVVQAALLAVESPVANQKTYIVTDGQEYSTSDVCSRICQILGRRMPRWTVPLPLLRLVARTGDLIGAGLRRRFIFNSALLHRLTSSAWYSSGKIQRELGYKPAHTIEDALTGTMEQHRRSQRAR